MDKIRNKHLGIKPHTNESFGDKVWAFFRFLVINSPSIFTTILLGPVTSMWQRADIENNVSAYEISQHLTWDERLRTIFQAWMITLTIWLLWSSYAKKKDADNKKRRMETEKRIYENSISGKLDKLINKK